MLLFITAVSCKRQLITYQGKADIYFNNAAQTSGSTENPLADTIGISFSLVTVKDSVRKIVINAAGAPANVDRTYSLSVDASSTAVAGKDYDVLPTSFTIKKNMVKDTVLLKMHRTLDMQTKNLSIILNLNANENFVTEMKDKVIDVATGKRMSFIKYRVMVNDIVKKPGRWQDSYFGVFTRKKLNFMCGFLNITPDYLDKTIGLAEAPAYGRLIQKYFNEQKAAGNTILEEDGSPMMMGPSSQ